MLDIGTSKICCAIAKCDNRRGGDNARYVKILGVGVQQAKGITKNGITNLEQLESAIINAVSDAENGAQKRIKSLFISIPGWAVDICCVDSSINLGKYPIDDMHIQSLLKINTPEYIDSSSEIIHMFPIEYTLDGVGCIQDPVGMVGNELSALINIWNSNSLFINNIKNCITRNNINVSGFILSSYASGLAVLLREEISTGATLIDMGGAVTNIVFFKNGMPLYTDTIKIGSKNITNDISTTLRTSAINAERLKIMYGAEQIRNMDEQSFVTGIDEYGKEGIQTVSKELLDTVISARLAEILELAEKRVQKLGATQDVLQKVVITGGGSQISGLMEFIKTRRIFRDSAIRLGRPVGIQGGYDYVQTAAFASTGGAIIYCLNEMYNKSFITKKSIMQRIVNWIKCGI